MFNPGHVHVCMSTAMQTVPLQKKNEKATIIYSVYRIIVKFSFTCSYCTCRMKEYPISFHYFCLCSIGRHVQSGIDDITSDDRWALYLDKLNEAIWPGGKLQEGSEKPKTEIEKARTRKEAVQALMDAFPGTLKARLHRRFLSRQLDATFDGLKLH